jgi:predicted O-methyltransferase YrrM
MATFGGQPEAARHPHVPEERASEFSTIDAGSPEVECLDFLFALVRLFKPGLLLETGTGSGMSTIALAAAIRANGAGHLHTVDLDDGCLARAKANITTFEPDLLQHVSFEHGDSCAFASSWPGPPFDFAFFDSLIPLRLLEFGSLHSRGMLSPRAVCVFHDTSRLRGQTMHDYSQEVIDALDRASEGRQWLEWDLSRGLRLIKLG